jgi:hypothetical protein
MSRAGRIAVFVNLALSLIFACWAYSLYYNRLDYDVIKKARDEQESAIKKTIEPAEKNLVAVRAALNSVETRRPALLAWYKQQLDNLHTGKEPVQALVFVNGDLQLDARGYPQLGPITNSANQPIAVQGSLDALRGKYTATQKQILSLYDEANKVAQEIRELTKKIGHGGDAKQGGGLRGDLAQQQLAEKRSLNEQEFLEPLLYNRLAELAILGKRHTSLEARLKEVETSTVTQKP